MVIGRNYSILLVVMVLSVTAAYFLAYYLPSHGINLLTFGQVFPQFSSSVNTSGLVGYWKFDDGSGTTAFDSTGNNNNATLSGTSFSSSSCQVAGCINFPGGGRYVSIPDSPSLRFGTGDFSIGFWLKYPSQSGNGYGYSMIIGNQGQTPQGIACFTDVYSGNAGYPGHLQCRVQGSNYVDSVSSNLNDNTWRYFTFVRNGTTLYLYINGILDNSRPVSSINVNTGQPFVLGANSVANPSAQDLTGGHMDELQMWNRALTADEINTLYLNGGGINPPPKNYLEGYWKFDEGSGNTINDSSGNGNTGTLVNSPTWTTGMFGNGLKFNGVNQYVAFSPTNLPTGDAPHSISAWLYQGSLPSNRAWILLLGNPGSGSHHWLINSAGGTQFGIWDRAQVYPQLPVGQWTFIVITYDGTNIRSYVNGVLDQTVTVGAQKFYLANSFEIAQAQIGENYWNGTIDEVRIYNKALSASEIAGLYNGTNTTTTFPPTCASGTINASTSVQYSNYTIFSNTGNNNTLASIVVENQTNDTIDTKIINQGNSGLFTDLDFNVNVISVNAMTNGTVVGVVVNITSPDGICKTQTGCVQNNPYVSVNPNSVKAKLGDQINFTANVTNLDSIECGSTHFVFNATQVFYTLFNVTFPIFNMGTDSDNFVLQPNESRIANFSYETNFAFAASYPLNVTASDITNINHSGVGNFLINVSESVLPSNFTCSSISIGFRCNFDFTTNVLDNVRVLFLVSNSKGKIVSSGGAISLLGNSLTFDFYCTTFGPGTYKVSWMVFNGLDSSLTNPISYSTTSEDKTLTC